MASESHIIESWQGEVYAEVCALLTVRCEQTRWAFEDLADAMDRVGPFPPQEDD